jgi:purine-binding chemotaxis protein CheW
MVDFRICLGLPTAAVTPATRVLVVESDTGGERPLGIGLVVDRVLDVSTWSRDAIEPLPDTGTTWHSRHVVSVLRRDGGFVGLLELDGILAGMAQILAQSSAAPPVATVS